MLMIENLQDWIWHIRYMDKHGFPFLMMVKGMKMLVRSIVLGVKGSFEFSRKYSIRSYKVSGITVRCKLFETDEKERYFHVYYSDRKEAAEREVIENKIDRMAKSPCAGRRTKASKIYNFAYYKAPGRCARIL